MDAKQRFCPSNCTSYSICLCDTGTHCSISCTWWGSSLPGLAELCFFSEPRWQLCLSSSSPPALKGAVPSPVLRKLFLPGLEATLALPPVWTTHPDPDVRITWRKVLLQMGCMSVCSQGDEEFLEEVGFVLGLHNNHSFTIPAKPSKPLMKKREISQFTKDLMYCLVHLSATFYP